MPDLIKLIYKAVVPDKARLEINHLLFRIRALKFKGTAVTCNCCRKQFSGFLPFGSPRRKGAACPHCNSLERNRLLLVYLERETSFFAKPNRVLHFAPEYSLEKRFKKLKKLDYTSGDINPALAMQQVDITAINFPNEQFDFIICSHVLMHVADEELAICELFRVLKPGGSAVIMTYINPALDHTFELPLINSTQDRLRHYNNPDVFRLHGKDFSERLEKAGFKVNPVDYAAALGVDMTLKYGLGENEIIFHCTK